MASRVSSTAPAARALYRKILRAAARWEGDAAEIGYILTESRAAFERGANLDGAEAVGALAQGEKRVEVAIHYQIAYERPEYLGGGGGEGVAAHKRKPKLFKDQRRVINVAGGSKWLDPKTGRLSESQHSPIARGTPPRW